MLSNGKEITIFIAVAVSAIALAYRALRGKPKSKTLGRKEYHGSCHCKRVKFHILDAPTHLVVWDCNCSICKMKKNWHFIIPETTFKLISG